MELLPVFPLPLVVLPTELVALHLFEARYKELYRDCKKGEAFVIVNGDSKKRENTGTLVKINKVIEEHPNGTVDLIVQGLASFEISNFLERFPGKLYSGVIGSSLILNPIMNQEFLPIAQQFLLEIKNKSKTNLNRKNLFELAIELGVSDKIKQELLEANNSENVIRLLKNEIQLQLLYKKQEEQLNNQFFLN